MRLYHVTPSRSTRVLWLPEEIGQPYELTVMKGDERRTDETVASKPRRDNSAATKYSPAAPASVVAPLDTRRGRLGLTSAGLLEDLLAGRDGRRRNAACLGAALRRMSM